MTSLRVVLMFLSLTLLSACATTAPEVRGREESAAQVYANLGQSYLERNNLREAKTALERSLELNPRSARTHVNYARLQERLESPAEAEKHYREALRLEPENGEIHNAYAVFLCREGRYAQADEAFRRAYRNPLYEAPERAMTNAGICARRAGEPSQAEDVLRRALERNPLYVPALYEMAELTFEDARYLQTRAYLQRLHDIMAPTPETLWMCHQAEMELGDRNAAARCGLRLKNDFPGAPQTARLLELERSGR